MERYANLRGLATENGQNIFTKIVSNTASGAYRKDLVSLRVPSRDAGYIGHYLL